MRSVSKAKLELLGGKRVEKLSRRVIVVGPLAAIVGLVGDHYVRMSGGHASIHKSNKVVEENAGLTWEWLQEDNWQRPHDPRNSLQTELPGLMCITVRL